MQLADVSTGEHATADHSSALEPGSGGSRHLALSATYLRSRERFLALHEIAEGSCATAVGARRTVQAATVTGWLHACNQRGPKALMYQRTGGRLPFCPDIAGALGDQVRSAQRQAAGKSGRSAENAPCWRQLQEDTP